MYLKWLSVALTAVLVQLVNSFGGTEATIPDSTQIEASRTGAPASTTEALAKPDDSMDPLMPSSFGAIDRMDDKMSEARPEPLSFMSSSNNESKDGGGKRKKNKGGDSMMDYMLMMMFIPLALQSHFMPMFLFKMKILAMKAFALGKLALLLTIFNMVRGSSLGGKDIDQQYENEAMLAQEHYGYTGGPEFGAWVNRRKDTPLPYKAYYTTYRHGRDGR